MIQKLAFLVLIAPAILAGGCAVYRIDIQQGNVVDQAMVQQLEPGMSAQKVRFLMGTPMIVDTLNPQRWDYLYRFQSGWSRPEQRHISLFFNEYDSLTRVEGDVTPLQDEPAPVTLPAEPAEPAQPIL